MCGNVRLWGKPMTHNLSRTNKFNVFYLYTINCMFIIILQHFQLLIFIQYWLYIPLILHLYIIIYWSSKLPSNSVTPVITILLKCTAVTYPLSNVKNKDILKHHFPQVCSHLNKWMWKANLVIKNWCQVCFTLPWHGLTYHTAHIKIHVNITVTTAWKNQTFSLTWKQTSPVVKLNIMTVVVFLLSFFDLEETLMNKNTKQI